MLKTNKQYQEKSLVKVYIRTGRYDNFYYSTLNLDVSHISPIGDQCKITADIIRLYNIKNRATVFIHGVTCAGKSSIGYLVAKQLKGSFCHSFNPTDPGDQFCNMIREFKESDNDEGRPIIIVLEEVNEIIHAVHNKTIERNYKIPTPVLDKSSWCSFLDDMVFYKNVILILTSNNSKDAIDTIDPAYLRQGRIDATYNMTIPLTFC